MSKFNCYRGDVDNIAITEDGSFIVSDTSGRNWICHEIANEDPTGAGAFVAAFAMMEAQHVPLRIFASWAGALCFLHGLLMQSWHLF